MNTQSLPALMIAAPWRSSGKTTLSMGLARALRDRGYPVQCFKKGPDYIDPMWLASASGRPCYNIDPWMQSAAEMQATFNRGGHSLRLIEAAMGVHDGLCEEGSDSSAGIARALNVPVILVINCKGMHRTAAALLAGITAFDPQVNFSGVILNRVSTSRHEAKLRFAIEQHTDLRVYGAIGQHPAINIDERELGLLPTAQHSTHDAIAAAATVVEAHCDVAGLLRAEHRVAVAGSSLPTQDSILTGKYRIGVAFDEAFNFYYTDDLERLTACGATLEYFSPLRDNLPESLDGLLLGGGFPERFAAQLAENTHCRAQIKTAIETGLPAHAECGGLMYLCKSIEQNGNSWPMAGVIDAQAVMHKKPVGRGYAKLQYQGGELPAHEFHHAALELNSDVRYAYRVLRGVGIHDKRDGIIVNNTIASFAHLRHTARTPWIDEFLMRVSQHASMNDATYV